MSTTYRELLQQIRQAYASVQAGALRPSIWKREGASSYTVKREQLSPSASQSASAGGPIPAMSFGVLVKLQYPMTTPWGKRRGWEIQKIRIARGDYFYRMTGRDYCRNASSEEIALWRAAGMAFGAHSRGKVE